MKSSSLLPLLVTLTSACSGSETPQARTSASPPSVLEVRLTDDLTATVRNDSLLYVSSGLPFDAVVLEGQVPKNTIRGVQQLHVDLRKLGECAALWTQHQPLNGPPSYHVCGYTVRPYTGPKRESSKE